MGTEEKKKTARTYYTSWSKSMGGKQTSNGFKLIAHHHSRGAISQLYSNYPEDQIEVLAKDKFISDLFHGNTGSE